MLTDAPLLYPPGASSYPLATRSQARSITERATRCAKGNSTQVFLLFHVLCPALGASFPQG